MESEHPKVKSSFLQDLKDIVIFAAIAFIILLPIRLYVAQPFIVVGTSMEPTFENGDYLIVDEISYKLEKPQRGDVIVFKFPDDQTKDFIKRIIGLPGETVVIKNNTITIINKANPKGFVLNESYLTFKGTMTDETITLDNNSYFVMGDNRPVSYDSRSWGPVSSNLIIGKALFRALPLDQIAIFPGKESQ